MHTDRQRRAVRDRCLLHGLVLFLTDDECDQWLDWFMSNDGCVSFEAEQEKFKELGSNDIRKAFKMSEERKNKSVLEKFLDL